MSKARHRGDILEFTIKDNNHLAVSGATFNLYVRGDDWIRENEPNLLKNRYTPNSSDNNGERDIVSSIDGTKSVTDNIQESTDSGSIYKQNVNYKNLNNNQISISINRFIHRNPIQQSQSSSQQQQLHQQQSHQKYTRTDSNYIGEIPKGKGEWKQFNITLMVNDWIQQQRQQVYDSNMDIVQEIFVKTAEPWMRQFLVLDTDSSNVS